MKKAKILMALLTLVTCSALFLMPHEAKAAVAPIADIVVDYTEEGDADGTVYATSIKNCTATTKATSYVYTGNALRPAVTVKNGTTTLVRNTDYKVSYKNNVNVGVATITITGIGKYTGTKTLKFTIKPQAVTGVTASCISTGVQVKWTGVSNATGYLVYRSANGGSYTKIATTTDLTIWIKQPMHQALNTTIGYTAMLL